MLQFLTGLLLAPLAVISIDGSPIFPVYFFPWIAAYFAYYGAQKRTPWPLLILGLAVGAALLMDAIYALPLYGYQADFPRAGLARLHNPLALPLFLIVPLTGSPGPALGFPDSAQEYSLYTGPVLLYLLYHYRDRLRTAGTGDARRRWLVLAIFFFIIGLGSLRSLGVSWLFSPFDVLARLPGFRSVGSTSRYWGFLVIPLSLLCARAVWWFLAEDSGIKRPRLVLALMFVFQFGFQAVVLVQRLASPVGLSARALDQYDFRGRHNPNGQGVKITHQITGKKFRMASRLTPATDIIDCYQNMEYPQGRIEPGDKMVIAARGADGPGPVPDFESRWLTFSQFSITCPAKVQLPRPDPSGKVLLVLNQNYYKHWSASRGEIVRTEDGNLGLSIRPDELGPEVLVTYLDPWSVAGEKISRAAGPAWLGLVTITALVYWRRRDQTSPAPNPAHETSA